MNWKDYSSLKSDGNASFAKEKVTTREAIAEVTPTVSFVTLSPVIPVLVIDSETSPFVTILS